MTCRDEDMTCIGCKKAPDELEEYSPDMTGTELNPFEYVWAEEGTLNTENGHFACTICYIKMGQPSSPTGWVAP